MKMTSGVEWAVHCCVAMSRAEGPVPATRLADFHGVSRTYLAKALQGLSRAGLTASVEGREGGYVLTRSPAEITLLDVVRALEGPEPAFRCTEIRQRGPMPTPPEACSVPCGVAQAMYRAEDAWRQALAETSIADLAAKLERDNGEGTLVAVATWLRPEH